LEFESFANSEFPQDESSKPGVLRMVLEGRMILVKGENGP